MQEFPTYKDFWNHQARDRLNALLAVDGSGDETVLRCTGGFWQSGADCCRRAVNDGSDHRRH